MRQSKRQKAAKLKRFKEAWKARPKPPIKQYEIVYPHDFLTFEDVVYERDGGDLIMEYPPDYGQAQQAADKLFIEAAERRMARYGEDSLNSTHKMHYDLLKTKL